MADRRDREACGPPSLGKGAATVEPTAEAGRIDDQRHRRVRHWQMQTGSDSASRGLIVKLMIHDNRR
jgi:hypothetical protein